MSYAVKQKSESTEGGNEAAAQQQQQHALMTFQRHCPWTLIYIMEAHAADGWRMGQPKDVNQHKSMEDRYREAKAFREELAWELPMVVDSWSTPCGNPAHGFRCGSPNFERLYGSWPTRVYILDNKGKIVHKGMPRKAEVDMETLVINLQAAMMRTQEC